MSRSAASRAAMKAASMRPRRRKLGICPVCELPIYAHQLTAWRSVDGATARLHDTCKDPS